MGHLVGRADGVITRVEGYSSNTSSTTVLSFRLDDPSGGRPVEVDLRGRTISGSVREGDWVEVADRRGRSGRVEVARLDNLTTGSQVSAAGSSRSPVVLVLAVLVGLIFVAVFVTIVYFAVMAFRTPF